MSAWRWLGLGAAAAAFTAATAASRRRRHQLPRVVSVASRVGRSTEVARLASHVGATAASNRARRVFASAPRRQALDAELQLRTAEQVAETLGHMKGALMKVGQLASFVDDAMPEPVRAALGQLQQDAPPMSGELAAEVIERELGADPGQLFLEWDPVPIAAASIGQVHRAITRDERAVAVKVQYPGVEGAIRADLDNMDLGAVVMPVVWGSLAVKAMTGWTRARRDEELN